MMLVGFGWRYDMDHFHHHDHGDMLWPQWATIHVVNDLDRSFRPMNTSVSCMQLYQDLWLDIWFYSGGEIKQSFILVKYTITRCSESDAVMTYWVSSVLSHTTTVGLQYSVQFFLRRHRGATRHHKIAFVSFSQFLFLKVYKFTVTVNTVVSNC